MIEDEVNKTTNLVNAVYEDLNENFGKWHKITSEPREMTREGKNTRIIYRLGVDYTKVEYMFIDQIKLTEAQTNAIKHSIDKQQELKEKREYEESVNKSYSEWGIE